MTTYQVRSRIPELVVSNQVIVGIAHGEQRGSCNVLIVGRGKIRGRHNRRMIDVRANSIRSGLIDDFLDGVGGEDSVALICAESEAAGDDGVLSGTPGDLNSRPQIFDCESRSQ